MKLETFFENFDLLTDAPNAATKLRELVLQLAVRGKLVEQDPEDESAQKLFDAIQSSKQALYTQKAIRKKKGCQSLDSEGIPFKIPRSWKWVKLHEICWLITDGTHHTPRYEDCGVPFVSVKNLSKGFIDLSDTKFISQDAHKELCNRCKPEYGDILLTKVGTTGIAVEIDVKEEFSIFVSVALLKHFSNFTYPTFLSYLLNSPLVKVQSEAGTEGVGNKNLVLRKIYNFTVPLPPLPEQKRIVEACDRILTLCDKIDQHQQQRHEKLVKMNDVAIAKLLTAQTPDDFDTHWQRLWQNFDLLYSIPETIPKLRQAILQLAVQGKLVEQDPNDESGQKLIARMIQEREQLIADKKIRDYKPQPPIDPSEMYFEVPQGWGFSRLGEIMDIVSGVTKGRKLAGRETTVYPYLRVANVQRGYLDLSVMKEIEIPSGEIEKYRLIEGDVLLTEGGDWDKLGRSAIWRGEIENCIHQNHVFRARTLDTGLLSEWVAMYANSPVGRTYFESAAKRTTNLASINMTQLRGCPFPVPPLAEQKRIVAKVDRLMALCDAMEARLTAARAQRETLMEAAARQVLAV